jgi:hypothetical protein
MGHAIHPGDYEIRKKSDILQKNKNKTKNKIKTKLKNSNQFLK